APSRILLVGTTAELPQLEALAQKLNGKTLVAIALIGNSKSFASTLKEGYTLHTLSDSDPALPALISRADGIVATPSTVSLTPIRNATAPVATWASTPGLPNAIKVASVDDPVLMTFFR
ncbi:MAG: hypothetical protein ABIQ44_00505, partial [Chloroflexia bacterium]